MKHTREQKRAKLLAEAQAIIEEFLDWEEQVEQPKPTAIEDEVLGLRERFGQYTCRTCRIYSIRSPEKCSTGPWAASSASLQTAKQ